MSKRERIPDVLFDAYLESDTASYNDWLLDREAEIADRISHVDFEYEMVVFERVMSHNGRFYKFEYSYDYIDFKSIVDLETIAEVFPKEKAIIIYEEADGSKASKVQE